MKYSSFFLIAALALAGCSAKGDTASEKRAAIQSMRTETLNKLYSLHPEARSDVQHSEGYAVFSSNNSKIFLFGFGGGFGIVKDRHSGKDTYMKMAQGGAGLGLGLKQQDTVMVFHDRAVLNKFITNGYVVGADANAAATYDNQGIGAIGASAKGVAPDSAALPSKVNVYEITEKGLSAQAMLNGYKYWPDDELNK
ncbi:YSC84-related protein [Scandinavium sp. H11S7]|uniref:YSC84-related protein n=1 Tax=Scandinavium hiltneri TaxID=2926519 RepID=A0ABT2E6Y8_9ENTR|nr:YSC84-related protein [Scandinavium hiltneri]MCS2158056.1 YSC84-related protein [Scandinavium hiltneri]MCS2163649.1 YSC84-related protein [Scandinavium hiltneri]